MLCDSLLTTLLLCLWLWIEVLPAQRPIIQKLHHSWSCLPYQLPTLHQLFDPSSRVRSSAASPTLFLNSSRKGMLYILKLAFSSLKCSLCKISSSVVFDSLWPTGYSPPGSFVHGILQARILDWVVISSSGGSSPSRDQTHVSQVPCIGQVGSLPLAPPGKPWNSLKENFKKYNEPNLISLSFPFLIVAISGYMDLI